MFRKVGTVVLCLNVIKFATVPRGLLPDALVGLDILDSAWKELGMTQTTYSWGRCMLSRYFCH